MSDNTQLFKSIENRQKELTRLSYQLSELESQLSLIFAASPDLIVFIHRDGQIVKASQAIWRILGYAMEDIIGKFIWDFIHPDDIEKTRAIRTELINNRFIFFDQKQCFTNRWRHSNGNFVKLAWRFSLYDEKEDQTIGFATDITKTVMDNPFSFSLVHKAISLAKDGIIITDNTIQHNPIMYVNDAFCKSTGYSRSELLGNNCRILQSDDKSQKALSTIRDAVSMGEGCEVLLRNFRKDKTVFFNHISTTPIVENHIVTNFIGISRDVTELVNSGIYIWDPRSPRGFGAALKTESHSNE